MCSSSPFTKLQRYSIPYHDLMNYIWGSSTDSRSNCSCQLHACTSAEWLSIISIVCTLCSVHAVASCRDARQQHDLASSQSTARGYSVRAVASCRDARHQHDLASSQSTARCVVCTRRTLRKPSRSSLLDVFWANVFCRDSLSHPTCY